MSSPRFPLFALSALFLAGLAPLARAATESTPLLRGILIDSTGNLFSLADATGSATWTKLGQSFDGWKLDAFDADRKVLTISHGGVTRELTLETGTIKADDRHPTFAEADTLLEKMRFEDMISKSLENQQKAMAKAFGQMGGKKMSDAESAKMADIQTKAMKLMFDEMDVPGMRKDLAHAMTEIYTPDEIRAQTAFYSTPLGQASIEKQPQLQARMTELMMPRMMHAMPKIQAMVKEETAKAAAPATPAPAAPATGTP